MLPLRPETSSRPGPDRDRQAHQAGLPSVLFDGSQDSVARRESVVPEFFVDLNLDQIVEAITAGRPEYDLKPFFHAPLRRIETIRYRHEVFRDLEDPKLLANIRKFAQGMRDVRVHSALSAKLHDRFHKEMWFVHAVEIYCTAVQQFAADLAGARLKSRGLLAFRDFLSGYVGSAGFASLRDEAKSITRDLSELNYSIAIYGGDLSLFATITKRPTIVRRSKPPSTSSNKVRSRTISRNSMTRRRI
jgi:DNA mismatch repair protein MutS